MRFKCLKCPYVDSPPREEESGGSVAMWNECGGGWSWGSKRCPQCQTVFVYPRPGGFIPGDVDGSVSIASIREIVVEEPPRPEGVGSLTFLPQESDLDRVKAMLTKAGIAWQFITATEKHAEIKARHDACRAALKQNDPSAPDYGEFPRLVSDYCDGVQTEAVLFEFTDGALTGLTDGE